MKKEKSFISILVITLVLLVFIGDINIVSANDYDVSGPKDVQYIGDGNIYMTWNDDKVVDRITLQDYEGDDLLVTHAWKVRSDQPITGGFYNLSNHYEDWTLQSYMKNGGKYRLHLTGPDDVDFYSNWFIAMWGESDDVGDLKLSVKLDEIEEGEELTIRFNDIGANYYIIYAECKDGVEVSGKARPDICVEGEKIYPTGKDVLSVGDFYPSADRNTSFIVEVAAYKDSPKEAIQNDREVVKIEAYDNKDDDSDEYNSHDDKDSDKDLSGEQILKIVSTMYGENSQVYRIINILVILGLI